MDKKELLVLSILRKNARKTLTNISKKTNIPISTLFEHLKKYEKNIIRKHTTLLNFSELGYNLKVYMILKSPKQNRDNLKDYLIKNQYINNLMRITNGSDFIIEAIFKNINEFQIFCDNLEKFNTNTKEAYYVLEDLKRESFLTDETTIGII